MLHKEYCLIGQEDLEALKPHLQFVRVLGSILKALLYIQTRSDTDAILGHPYLRPGERKDVHEI